MITPIYIIDNTKNCITQDGKQYCEDKNTTPKELGFISLGVVAFGLYVALIFWLADKYFDDSMGFVFGMSVGLPLLIFGLVLVL